MLVMALVGLAAALDLQASPAVLGGEVRLWVTGASPGAEVHLARGRAAGDGGCPPALGGACLGVVGASRLGVVVADPAGEAELRVRLPEGLAEGLSVAWQAFEPATGRASSPWEDQTVPPANVLLVLADDLGVDKVARFGIGAPATPPTPNLDRLMDEGVRFDRAYTSPSCSPARAILQTGRQPHQHGVGFALTIETRYALPFEEVTLPEWLLDRAGGRYRDAFVGKWHLGGNDFDYFFNPQRHGWSHSRALLHGLKETHASDGLPMTYYDWEEVVDGVPGRVSTYMTTANADAVIELMDSLPEPWVVVWAPFAPHAPYHWPPEELWSASLGSTDARQKFNAAVQALDTELGRVLDALPPEVAARTLRVFLGDNGTPGSIVEDPVWTDRSKETVYELGVRTPLVVAGPGVERGGTASRALVHVADLLPTVMEVAGAPLSSEDLAELYGRSLLPWLREPARPSGRVVVQAEMFQPAGGPPHDVYLRCAREERYKLHQELGGPDRLYDLAGRELEGEDLLAAGPLTAEQADAYARLLASFTTPLE